jgi:hypothetical protein
MNHEVAFARARRALSLVFVADALSMPAHWFYNPNDIRTYFGPAGITGMVAAPATHPVSIMNLHSTSGGGRGSQGKGPDEVVGNVILKGKREKWGKAKMHYHDGMPAGENTLNAYCARLMLRDVLTRHTGRYSRDEFLKQYVDFMTADPPRHPDTYAESFHRGFFANLIHHNKPLTECGAVTHDTPSVGGLVMIAPLAISELLVDGNVPRVQQIARQHLALTHPDETLSAICDEYVDLVSMLMLRPPMRRRAPRGDHDDEDDDDDDDYSDRTLILRAASKWVRNPNDRLKSKGVLFTSDRRLCKASASEEELDELRRFVDRTPVSAFVGRIVSSACYITDSWPAVLFLAAKFSREDPLCGLLANTNAGGENCHRGSVLGSILGLTDAAEVHHAGVERAFNQLLHAESIEEDIAAWHQCHERFRGGSIAGLP